MGNQFDEIDRRVLYAVVAVLVLIAGTGVMYAVISLGGMEPAGVDIDMEIEESSASDEVKITVERLGERVDGMNVTTERGGGTGELLNGVSEGDTVTLEAVDEPEWRENGTGTYDAEGDEILVVGVHNDTRATLEVERIDSSDTGS